MLEFKKPKSTRKFQVKPVFLVNENHNSEHLSRPLKLRTLVIKKLSKLFTRNHEIFVQNHAIEIIQCLPPELRNEIFNAIEKISVLQPNYPADNVFKAWQMFFSSDKLVLKEFLGHHWSKLVFSYLVNSSKVFEDVNQLVLQSNEINQADQERRCFLFELSESCWKPELKTLLSSRLPSLVSVTLHDFCDDDTLSLVGHHCHHLSHLHISLGPESYREQQLSDDGFSDLIDIQAERGTLRELNIAECHSASVTAKTVLNLAKIPSLAILHLMLDHFKWMEISMRFLGEKFSPSKSVRTLVIKDSGRLDFRFPDLRSKDGVNFVKALFPEVISYRIMDVWMYHGSKLRTIFDSKIYGGSVKKVRSLTFVHEMFMDAKSLSIEIIMNPKLEAHIRFDNLQDLTVIKEMFKIEFELIHDLLRSCPCIKKFKVEATSLADYNESKFMSLFHDTPHLRALEQFSLNFRISCKISMSFLSLLLETCRQLEYVGNLLTWEVSPEDMSAVEKLGKVAMFASRHHWSLPWRAEDGTLHEHTSSVTASAAGDMFDNY